jgi:hypothetical protein
MKVEEVPFPTKFHCETLSDEGKNIVSKSKQFQKFP